MTMTMLPNRDLLGIFRAPMRFTRGHLILLFFATLDILLTWWILALDGREVNPIARHVIEQWSLGGAIIFKFSLTFFVMIICEFIASRRDQTARRLMVAAITISSTAPCYAVFLLWWHARVLGNSLIPA